MKFLIPPNPTEICYRSSHSSRLSCSDIWQMMIIALGNTTAPKGSSISPPSTEVQVVLGWNMGSLPLTVYSYTSQEGPNINQVTPRWEYLLRTDEIIPAGVRAELPTYFLMLGCFATQLNQLLTSFGVLFSFVTETNISKLPKKSQV